MQYKTTDNTQHILVTCDYYLSTLHISPLKMKKRCSGLSAANCLISATNCLCFIRSSGFCLVRCTLFGSLLSFSSS